MALYSLACMSRLGEVWRLDEHGGRRWFQLYTPDLIRTELLREGLRVVSVAEEPGVLAGRWVNVYAQRTTWH